MVSKSYSASTQYFYAMYYSVYSLKLLWSNISNYLKITACFSCFLPYLSLPCLPPTWTLRKKNNKHLDYLVICHGMILWLLCLKIKYESTLNSTLKSVLYEHGKVPSSMNTSQLNVIHTVFLFMTCVWKSGFSAIVMITKYCVEITMKPRTWGWLCPVQFQDLKSYIVPKRYTHPSIRNCNCLRIK